MGMFFGNINPSAFYFGDKTINKILFKENIVWEKNGGGEVDDIPYLCFTAEEPNAKIIFNKGTEDNQIVISTDKQNWSSHEYGTEITLTNVGDKVYFRAADDVENQSFNGYRFDINNGKIAASGNLNTLLKADGSVLDLTGRDYCYSSMFADCTSLTQAPELPATTLASYCYSIMFRGCSSLTQAPELPATTLASYCYSGMFAFCKNLTSAPALPVANLADFCCNQMFIYCTSLTQAPELPAMTLVNGCYNSMFYNCTSLTQAPALPATELAEGCYSSMFQGCTALTQAPALPATELAEGCYSSMFQNCTSLTQAPELPATTLADNCYSSMFYSCTGLQNITINADENNNYVYNALLDMFNGATSLNEIRFTSLTFDEAKELLNNNDVAQGMFKEGPDPLYVAVYFEDGYYSSLADLLETELKCLKFTNTTDDGNWNTATLRLQNEGPIEGVTLEYSRDGGNYWEGFNINETYYIEPNETIMIRAQEYTTNTQFSNLDGYLRFDNNEYGRKLKVEGNLRYLISQDEGAQYIQSEYMFKNLFSGFNFTYDSNITIPKPYNPWDYPTYMCYNGLFTGSNINRITLEPDFESWYDEYGNDQHWTYDWVMNVPAQNDYDYNNGTFYCSSNLPLEYAINRIPEGWNVENI